MPPYKMVLPARLTDELPQPILHLVIRHEGHVAPVVHGQAVPVAQHRRPRLEQTREHVKLKVGDVVVTCEIYCCFQGAGLQALLVKLVHLVEALAECFPGHDGSVNGWENKNMLYFKVSATNLFNGILSPPSWRVYYLLHPGESYM